MRSGSTAALVGGALIFLTNCGEAVPVDRAARKAEDDSRAAARRVEDAATSKASRDRDAAFDRGREADAASRTEQAIGDDTGAAEDAPPPRSGSR
jgi:hypothetical protein